MLLTLLIALVLVGLALWVLLPREPVETAVRFDESLLNGGVSNYLAQQEMRFSDITPGVQKRVVWAGTPEEKTPVVLVYVHGFSATSEEVRPLPDLVAKELGANLIYTRLAGHGRTGAAMAEPSVADWMFDVAEALAIARRIGDRVIVIGTSTGATLLTLSLHEEMGQGVDGAVFLSPNFRVKAAAATILTWPGVRWWGPLVAGAERRFDAMNDAHGRYWTIAYPTVALLPMAASVKQARNAPHSDVKTPALFVFADTDQVVDHSDTREVAAAWGGPVHIEGVTPTKGDDPYHHVIAGDILSPGQTAGISARIVDWVQALPPGDAGETTE